MVFLRCFLFQLHDFLPVHLYFFDDLSNFSSRLVTLLFQGFYFFVQAVAFAFEFVDFSAEIFELFVELVSLFDVRFRCSVCFAGLLS